MVSFASANMRPYSRYAALALLEQYSRQSVAIISDQPSGAGSADYLLCGIPLKVLSAVRAQVNILQIATGAKTTGYDVPFYEAVSTVALVLNESCRYNNVECQSVVRLMLDRTFQLPLRPVTIDAEGRPVTVVYIQKRNGPSQSDVFEANKTIVHWIGSLVPYHRPLCGLRNEICRIVSSLQLGQTLTISLSVISVSAVLCITIGCILLIRARKAKLRFWCRLSEGDLDLDKGFQENHFHQISRKLSLSKTIPSEDDVNFNVAIFLQ
ncbi:hypothetical protein BV898_08369 [Hypsibius exemplaris]|uniref:Receptor ligand binding region domain-containing protein n=1 Tax=Hypsibius exemplaris TaxID=2072580 RepID=A0A1W0WQX0_HYPEX|nr:hypothetical protein BV898_08369 [Hypsibius exemplaris]